MEDTQHLSGDYETPIHCPFCYPSNRDAAFPSNVALTTHILLKHLFDDPNQLTAFQQQQSNLTVNGVSIPQHLLIDSAVNNYYRKNEQTNHSTTLDNQLNNPHGRDIQKNDFNYGHAERIPKKTASTITANTHKNDKVLADGHSGHNAGYDHPYVNGSGRQIAQHNTAQPLYPNTQSNIQNQVTDNQNRYPKALSAESGFTDIPNNIRNIQHNNMTIPFCYQNNSNSVYNNHYVLNLTKNPEAQRKMPDLTLPCTSSKKLKSNNKIPYNSIQVNAGTLTGSQETQIAASNNTHVQNDIRNVAQIKTPNSLSTGYNNSHVKVQDHAKSIDIHNYTRNVEDIAAALYYQDHLNYINNNSDLKKHTNITCNNGYGQSHLEYLEALSKIPGTCSSTSIDNIFPNNIIPRGELSIQYNSTQVKPITHQKAQTVEAHSTPPSTNNTYDSTLNAQYKPTLVHENRSSNVYNNYFDIHKKLNESIRYCNECTLVQVNNDIQSTLQASAKNQIKNTEPRLQMSGTSPCNHTTSQLQSITRTHEEPSIFYNSTPIKESDTILEHQKTKLPGIIKNQDDTRNYHYALAKWYLPTCSNGGIIYNTQEQVKYKDNQIEYQKKQRTQNDNRNVKHNTSSLYCHRKMTDTTPHSASDSQFQPYNNTMPHKEPLMLMPNSQTKREIKEKHSQKQSTRNAQGIYGTTEHTDIIYNDDRQFVNVIQQLFHEKNSSISTSDTQKQYREKDNQASHPKAQIIAVNTLPSTCALQNSSQNAQNYTAPLFDQNCLNSSLYNNAQNQNKQKHNQNAKPETKTYTHSTITINSEHQSNNKMPLEVSNPKPNFQITQCSPTESYEVKSNPTKTSIMSAYGPELQKLLQNTDMDISVKTIHNTMKEMVHEPIITRMLMNEPENKNQQRTDKFAHESQENKSQTYQAEATKANELIIRDPYIINRSVDENRLKSLDISSKNENCLINTIKSLVTQNVDTGSVISIKHENELEVADTSNNIRINSHIVQDSQHENNDNSNRISDSGFVNKTHTLKHNSKEKKLNFKSKRDKRNSDQSELNILAGNDINSQKHGSQFEVFNTNNNQHETHSDKNDYNNSINSNRFINNTHAYLKRKSKEKDSNMINKRYKHDNHALLIVENVTSGNDDGRDNSNGKEIIDTMQILNANTNSRTEETNISLSSEISDYKKLFKKLLRKLESKSKPEKIIHKFKKYLMRFRKGENFSQHLRNVNNESKFHDCALDRRCSAEYFDERTKLSVSKRRSTDSSESRRKTIQTESTTSNAYDKVNVIQNCQPLTTTIPTNNINQKTLHSDSSNTDITNSNLEKQETETLNSNQNKLISNNRNLTPVVSDNNEISKNTLAEDENIASGNGISLESDLNEDVKNHYKVYKCKACGMCFHTFNSFNSHTNRKIWNLTEKCKNRNKIKCTICPLVFSSQSMAIHKKYHHNTKKTIKVDIMADNDTKIDTIIIINDNENLGVIQADSKTKKHITKDPSTRIFTYKGYSTTVYMCRECRVCFSRKNLVQQHVHSQHKNKINNMEKKRRTNKCPICKLLFSVKGLVSHCKYHHVYKKMNTKLDFKIILYPEKNDMYANQNKTKTKCQQSRRLQNIVMKKSSANTKLRQLLPFNSDKNIAKMVMSEKNQTKKSCKLNKMSHKDCVVPLMDMQYTIVSTTSKEQHEHSIIDVYKELPMELQQEPQQTVVNVYDVINDQHDDKKLCVNLDVNNLSGTENRVGTDNHIVNTDLIAEDEQNLKSETIPTEDALRENFEITENKLEDSDRNLENRIDKTLDVKNVTKVIRTKEHEIQQEPNFTSINKHNLIKSIDKHNLVYSPSSMMSTPNIDDEKTLDLGDTEATKVVPNDEEFKKNLVSDFIEEMNKTHIDDRYEMEDTSEDNNHSIQRTRDQLDFGLPTFEDPLDSSKNVVTHNSIKIISNFVVNRPTEQKELPQKLNLTNVLEDSLFGSRSENADSIATRSNMKKTNNEATEILGGKEVEKYVQDPENNVTDKTNITKIDNLFGTDKTSEENNKDTKIKICKSIKTIENQELLKKHNFTRFKKDCSFYSSSENGDTIDTSNFRNTSKQNIKKTDKDIARSVSYNDENLLHTTLESDLALHEGAANLLIKCFEMIDNVRKMEIDYNSNSASGDSKNASYARTSNLKPDDLIKEYTVSDNSKLSGKLNDDKNMTLNKNMSASTENLLNILSDDGNISTPYTTCLEEPPQIYHFTSNTIDKVEDKLQKSKETLIKTNNTDIKNNNQNVCRYSTKHIDDELYNAHRISEGIQNKTCNSVNKESMKCPKKQDNIDDVRLNEEEAMRLDDSSSVKVSYINAEIISPDTTEPDIAIETNDTTRTNIGNALDMSGRILTENVSENPEFQDVITIDVDALTQDSSNSDVTSNITQRKKCSDKMTERILNISRKDINKSSKECVDFIKTNLDEGLDTSYNTYKTTKYTEKICNINKKSSKPVNTDDDETTERESNQEKKSLFIDDDIDAFSMIMTNDDDDTKNTSKQEHRQKLNRERVNIKFPDKPFSSLTLSVNLGPSIEDLAELDNDIDKIKDLDQKKGKIRKFKNNIDIFEEDVEFVYKQKPIDDESSKVPVKNTSLQKILATIEILDSDD